MQREIVAIQTDDIIEAPLAEGAVAFMLRCHGGDEFWEVPAWAVLAITPQRAQSLLGLCEAVRRLGVHKINDFDYSPTYYAWDEDDLGNEAVGKAERTEIDQVSCYGDGVRWSAAVRHTNMTFSTEEIPVARLLEIAEQGCERQPLSP